MTTPLDFIHTLLADTNSKWNTVEQALLLFDSTGILPLPRSTLQWNDDQTTLFVYLAAAFLRSDCFSQSIQPAVADISMRNHYSDFHKSEVYSFLINMFGSECLVQRRAELGNRSFLQHLTHQNFNSYTDNTTCLFELMETVGTKPFEHIRVEQHTDTPQPFLAAMYAYLTPHREPEKRRFYNILLANDTNIADLQVDGVPCVSLWCKPKLWDMYLNNGGNPDVTVTHNYKQKPLWSALIEKSEDMGDHELNTHLKHWGATHHKNVQNVIENAYFTRLKSRVGSYKPRYQDLKDVVTSSPNWFEFADEEGRTPMMLAVASQKSAYKIFFAKKYRTQLGKRDNKGRTVLSYAIKDAPKISPEALQFLFSVPELLTLPEDGRGIIHHLNDFNAGVRGMANYMMPEDETVRLEQMRAWVGAPEHQKMTAHIIANRYFQDIAYQHGITRLVRLGVMRAVKRRDLLGAMVLCVAGNLAHSIQSYQRSYAWKPSDQLNPETHAKQIRANLVLTQQIDRLEKMLSKAVAPTFQSEEVQKRWSDVLPSSVFQSIGCDYSFTTLCDRMSKNSLTQALGAIDSHPEPTKSRKL